MNGTITNPFNEIIKAIEAISYTNTIIYLLGGDFYLNSLGNNNPLSLINYTEITIQPYFCSQGAYPGCYNKGERAKITFTNETITFYITQTLILKNIILSHDYPFDSNCNGCNYCPYTTTINGIINDDRGQILHQNQYLSQSFCSNF